MDDHVNSADQNMPDQQQQPCSWRAALGEPGPRLQREDARNLKSLFAESNSPEWFNYFHHLIQFSSSFRDYIGLHPPHPLNKPNQLIRPCCQSQKHPCIPDPVAYATQLAQAVLSKLLHQPKICQTRGTSGNISVQIVLVHAF